MVDPEVIIKPTDLSLIHILSIKYERSDYEFSQGNIRVRGDIIEVFPAYQDYALRIQLFGDEIEKIIEFHPVSGELSGFREMAVISPATHFLASSEWIPKAISTISKELCLLYTSRCV